MNNALIKVIKDGMMMHMHNEEWMEVVHATSPMAVLNSRVLNKHNVLCNAILI